MPQEVVTPMDITDTVDPHAIRDPPFDRSRRGHFSEPPRERIHPRHEFGPHPLSPMLTHVHSPRSPLRQKGIQSVSGGYAAGRSAERWSVTGTAVPTIVSKTRTRPAPSSRSSVPTKSANGPDRIRTVCPVVSAA